MEKLTTQHCLYVISNNELKEFHALYARWKNELPNISAKIHNDEDALADVLNCWVIIRHYSSFDIKKTDKGSLYTCNTYIDNLLRDSADLARIVQLWKDEHDQLFILSYHLALHILDWIDYVLLTENEEIAEATFKACQRRNYYVHNPDYLLPISNQAIYIKQHLVTSLLIKDNNRMNQIIEKSINETNTVSQMKIAQLS